MSTTTKTIPLHPNSILEYTQGMFKSETARVDGQLTNDFQTVMQGHCMYLRKFLCEKNDFTILENLTKELSQKAEEDSTHGGMINWSRHFKYENPDFSPTFQSVLRRLEEYFDVEIHATRLNFYPDASSWKPFHHDSHAYGEKGVKEDFTMGASFGSSRELVFLHPGSGEMFSFPQENGDVFAFDSDVNRRFQHGVPKAKTTSRVVSGPRFSIIAWGRRRTICERNGGAIGSAPIPNPAPVLRRNPSASNTTGSDEAKAADTGVTAGSLAEKNYFVYEDSAESDGKSKATSPSSSASATPATTTTEASAATTSPKRANEKGPEINEVVAMVNAFIEAVRIQEASTVSRGGLTAAAANASRGRGVVQRGGGIVQRGGMATQRGGAVVQRGGATVQRGGAAGRGGSATGRGGSATGRGGSATGRGGSATGRGGFGGFGNNASAWEAPE